MSDSEGENIKGWTLVGNQGDIESDNSSSGSSSGFVHLDGDQGVSYHHKTRRSLSLDSNDSVKPVQDEIPAADYEQSSLHAVSTEGDATNSAVDEPDSDEKPLSEHGDSTPGDVSLDELSNEGSISVSGDDLVGDATEDDLHEQLAASLTNSSPEFLDDAVVSALTATRPDTATAEVSSDEAEIPDGGEIDLRSGDVGNRSPEAGAINASSSENSESDISSLEHVEDLPQTVAAPVDQPDELSAEHAEKDEKSPSGSSSEIEELEMPEEEEMDLYAQGGHDEASALPPSEILRLQVDNRRRRSGSESDMSDIVKLDASMAVEDLPCTSSRPRRRRYTTASDLMQASASSTSSSGSSNLSSRFHFVQPLPVNHRYVYHRDEQEDAESLPGDVDDRCESDISGVAPDENDPDLSSVSYNIDDLEIYQGDVVRSYRHKPNSRLNAFLTALALLTLFTTLGVGIGHYLGTMRIGLRRDQQTNRLMELQDDYLRCLRQHEILEAQAAVTDQQKIAAVTAVWKEKYEELIIEKVELESSMKQLQAAMSDDLGEAQRKILLQRDSVQGVEEEINHLRSENDRYRSRINVLENSESTLLQDNEELEVHLQTLKDEQAELNIRIQQMEKEEDELKEEQDRLQAQYEQRIQEVEAERAAIQQLAAIQEKEKQEAETQTESVEAPAVDDEDVTVTVEDGDDETITEATQEQNVQTTPNPEISQSTDAVAKSRADLIREAINSDDSESATVLLKILDNVNLLEQENHELRTQVARLRYSQRQYTVQEVDEIMKVEANRLANENEDLKSVVGKLRYSQHSTEQGNSGVPEMDPTADSVPPPQGMPSESITEDQPIVDPPSCPPKTDTELAPSFLTCLSLLLPDVRMADIQKMFSKERLSNFTQPIMTQVQFLKNVTADVKFTETLGNKWSQLKKMVKSNKPDVGNVVENVIEDIQSTVSGRWNQFNEYVHSEDFEKVKTNTKTKFNSVVDRISNSSAVAKYQEFVNKTKESVSKLSKKIKKTWNKVKNLTGDFLSNNKAVTSFGDTVNKNLKKLGKSMESGWKKAQKKMEKSGWLPGSWGSKKEKKKHKEKVEEPIRYDDEPITDTIKQSVPRQVVVKSTEELDPKTKHKETKSSTADYEKYAEYWKQAEFEPDDFFQEGFFEGNNREWNKHQKRVRKLLGRLQRLNENIFLAMDDDDIEDMYDDFDGVQDDLDDSSMPENLMTWLTCQVRWWKSRLFRKHSTEDLVKGCAQKLTHWQLKALCTPSCARGDKKCQKQLKKGTLHQGPFCQYYQSVILPSISQETASDESSHESYHHHHQSSRRVIVMGVDQNNPVMSGDIKNEYGQLHYDMSIDSEDYELSESDGNTTDTESVSEDEEHAKWVFERAEDRESHRHDGSWAFKRDKGRHFERNKPWFYKRADHRAKERARDDHHHKLGKSRT